MASSANGEQDRLEPGIYTIRPVGDEGYVVLRNGEPFSATLTIKSPTAGS